MLHHRVTTWKTQIRGGLWSLSNLLDVETNKKVERNFAHVPSSINTDEFEPLPVVGVLHQDVAVEEAHEVVEEDEDDEIVVHQFEAGCLPAGHQFDKSSHPPGGVFILVLVDVVIPGDIFFVDRHLETKIHIVITFIALRRLVTAQCCDCVVT